EGDDIYGDGVNIAARLEGLAEPGGIVVSRAVRDHVRDKLDIAFDDLGEQTVKNIPRPGRGFWVRAQCGSASRAPPRRILWRQRGREISGAAFSQALPRSLWRSPSAARWCGW